MQAVFQLSTKAATVGFRLTVIGLLLVTFPKMEKVLYWTAIHQESILVIVRSMIQHRGTVGIQMLLHGTIFQHSAQSSFSHSTGTIITTTKHLWLMRYYPRSTSSTIRVTTWSVTSLR